MQSCFDTVRERVSALDAARSYGVEVDRRGKTAHCPFHKDKHPSMVFRNGRFRCYSCGASGSAIDLTSQLFGLAPIDAVKRLNDDFALGLEFDRKPTEAEKKVAQRRREIADAHEAFEAWRSDFILKLCYAYREGHLLLKDFPGLDKLTDQQATALRMQATIEYWIEVLSDGTPREQAQIYREREGIGKWIEKVLQN